MILLALIISVFVFIITESVVASVVSLIVSVVGFIACSLIVSKYRSRARVLFFIVFTIYSFFALMHYVDYVYYDQLMYTDENYFVTLAENFGKNSEGIRSAFNISYDINQIIDNRGYVFYITSVVSLVEKYLGEYNIYVLFLSSVAFGSLSSIILYRLLLYYVKEKQAFKYSLLFMLFSPLLLYSYVVLRDIGITFFFLLGFVLIHKKFSYVNLLLLVLLDFIIFQFRTEHGIVFILFIAFYIYKKFRTNKVVLISILISGLILSASFIYNAYITLSTKLERYKEFTIEQATSKGDGSIGAILQNFPSPLREVTNFFYSFATPFPSWVLLQKSSNIFEGITFLSPIFYSFFWFTICFSLLKWLLLKRRFAFLDKNLKILFLLSLALYAANLASFNIRRIMFVYPLIYLVYVYANENLLSTKEVKNTLVQSSLSYMGLILIYTVIKFI